MKRDADLFGSNDLPIPPSCLITIWADLSCNPERRLRHPVTLTGIDCNTRKIYISVDSLKHPLQVYNTLL